MHIYFNKEINSETVQELVDKLSEIEGKVSLWFSTVGGETGAMSFLISYLNSRAKDITVFITFILASAGTDILTDFKGKVELTDGLDLIMFHKEDRLIETLRKDKVINNSILLEQSEWRNKKCKEKLKKLGLNKEQLEEFDKGYDVVLYRKDFKQLKIER